MERYHFLDGLRGWGAIFVLLYHVFCDGLPVNKFSSEYLRLFVPFNGLIAVYVFFLVSGVALSIQYLSINKSRTLVKIAAGRYARLAIPIFAASLVVHLAMIAGMIEVPEERLPMFQHAVNFEATTAYLFQFTLIDVFFDYDGNRTYIGPLWTMSIELFGSFVVLATLAICGSLRWRIVLFSALAGVLLAYESMMALFVIGVVIAECFQRGWIDRVPLWVGVVCLALGCLAPFALSWRADAWNMISVSLLTLGCIRIGPIRQWLSSPLSRHLGKISFPLYLIHGPIMLVVGAPLMLRFGQGDVVAGVLIGTVTVVLSVAASYALVPANEIAVKVSRSMGNFAVSILYKKTVPA